MLNLYLAVLALLMLVVEVRAEPTRRVAVHLLRYASALLHPTARGVLYLLVRRAPRQTPRAAPNAAATPNAAPPHHHHRRRPRAPAIRPSRVRARARPRKQSHPQSPPRARRRDLR